VALLSIPSPGDPFLVDAGPFQIRWYGLLLATGVLLAGWIARRELRRRGADPELAYSIAIWTVPLGLVGARLYHVVTDWERFSGDLASIPAIWEGGLGIYGAVLGGMLGTWIGCRRVGLPFWEVADCIAPGLVLAQALGRWGNYFNQELYGKPSNRPWAVEIDSPPPKYPGSDTFHPTFLYESLWDLLVFGALVWFARRYWRRVPRGTVFALYLFLYSLGRVPIETLRIDPADMIAGQRLNVWVAGIVALVGLVAFVLLLRRGRARPPAPAAAAPAAPSPAVGPSGHQPTQRPEAAILARRKSQARRRRE
jgi:prolipoprotein diacylglyceryl transferase